MSGKNRNLYVFAVSPYSSHWYLAIPRESTRKPEVFCFQRVQKQSSGIKWVKYAHIQVFISHVKNHINNQKSAFLWSVFSICRLHGRIYQPFPIHSSFQSEVENVMTRKIPLPCDILLENEPFVYKLLTDLLYQQKVNQFKPSSWYSCSLLPFLYSGDLSNFFHWNSCGLVLI